MTTVSAFLESLRRCGKLADIDVVFASFIGRNAHGSPALTLLAALVSNESSMHDGTALPAERIWTKDALRDHLKKIASEQGVADRADPAGPPADAALDTFVDGLQDWPPAPDAFPRLFREIAPGAASPAADGLAAAAAAAPLVLSDGLLYLGRMYQDETFLRNYLFSHVGTNTGAAGPVDLSSVTSFELGTEQAAAVAAAVNSRFLVISGGPGTGKTTIVSVILALRAESPDEIVMCAPTGKAQVRMKEALNKQLKNLRVRTGEIAKIQSFTIHRLLSWQNGTFRYNAGNRLPYKLFIVDECSMIDLELMASLLKAVRDDASVILLGDQNQLSSVEPGSVFGDICGFLRARHPGCLAELTVSRRFREGGEIWTLKNAINAGLADAAWDHLKHNGNRNVLHTPLPGRDRLEAFLRARFGGTWLGADGQPYHLEETIDQAWARFDSFRILTPVNKGLFGADNLNAIARSILGFAAKDERRTHPDAGQRPHVPGETILIRENSHTLNVFNGDVGILWYADSDGMPMKRTDALDCRSPRLLVFFPDFTASGHSWRGLPPETLPDHAPAYAFTIHKSQGSDYSKVLMFLPSAGGAHSALLTREIVYTGLTRTKESIVISVAEDVFKGAVARSIDRVSGLRNLRDTPPEA